MQTHPAILDSTGALVAIWVTHGIFHRALVNGVHNAAHYATDQATIPICHHTLVSSSGVCRFVIVFRARHIGVCSALALLFWC